MQHFNFPLQDTPPFWGVNQQNQQFLFGQQNSQFIQQQPVFNQSSVHSFQIQTEVEDDDEEDGKTLPKNRFCKYCHKLLNNTGTPNTQLPPEFKRKMSKHVLLCKNKKSCAGDCGSPHVFCSPTHNSASQNKRKEKKRSGRRSNRRNRRCWVRWRRTITWKTRNETRWYNIKKA